MSVTHALPKKDFEVHNSFHVSLPEQDYKERADVQESYANTNAHYYFKSYLLSSHLFGLGSPHKVLQLSSQLIDLFTIMQ